MSNPIHPTNMVIATVTDSKTKTHTWRIHRIAPRRVVLAKSEESWDTLGQANANLLSFLKNAIAEQDKVGRHLIPGTSMRREDEQGATYSGSASTVGYFFPELFKL